MKIAHPSRVCVLILYTHTHVLSSTAKLHIYQSTTRTHTYTHVFVYTQTEKTLSSATYVFIKNSANGPETAISICNAVNNIPPGRRVALSNDLPPAGNEARLTNYCHNLSRPFSEYLGPFFRSYSQSLLSTSTRATTAVAAAARNNGRKQMAYTVYITLVFLPSVCSSIGTYMRTQHTAVCDGGENNT